MIFILLALSAFGFYYYYKTWGKEELKKSFINGAKGFGKGFKQGYFEQKMQELKKELNYYVIALLAKIAKSDGSVSNKEAKMIKELLDQNVSDERERAFLSHAFNEHKQNLNDAYEIAKEFIKNIPLPKNERINVLGLFVVLASIDEQNPTKDRILAQICEAFSLPLSELSRLKSSLNIAKSSSMDLKKAQGILELSENASFDEVKKSYRRLAKKYHPDVLNANKVSEEELKTAATKFQAINDAYEFIKKERQK